RVDAQEADLGGGHVDATGGRGADHGGRRRNHPGDDQGGVVLDLAAGGRQGQEDGDAGLHGFVASYCLPSSPAPGAAATTDCERLTMRGVMKMSSSVRS